MNIEVFQDIRDIFALIQKKTDACKPPLIIEDHPIIEDPPILEDPPGGVAP